MADPAARRTDQDRIITFNRRFALRMGFDPGEAAGDIIRMPFHQFKRIADGSPLPVSIISLSTMTYNYVNDSEAALFGYNSAEDVTGQSILFNAGYEGAKPEDAMGKMLDTGSTSEKTIVRPNGEVRELLGTYYAATEELDEYGLPAEFIGFDLDQTARKQREELFQSLSEFTYDWVIWLSPDGDIIYASPSSERITGYTDEEWMRGDIRLEDIIDPQDKAVFEDGLDRALRRQEMDKGEARVQTKHAGLRWLEAAYIPVYSQTGEFLGSRVSLRDITENKELQEKLVRAERLGVLGELAGSVSHELRNPLNVIKTSSYYLRNRLEDCDEKVERHLDRVERSVERADRTISDLLAFSRLKPTKFDRIHLESLVQRVVAETQLPGRTSISVDAPEDLPEVRVDQVQMEQVLHNLILNACQALNGDGHIDIDLRIEGDRLAMAVRDNGCGIAPADLSKVFEPLFTTKAEGTGFGLAVCKRIVEEHGGTIDMESEPGKGTVATIRIPLEV